MHDDDCVRFLQWSLPQLHMRWPGFRKVRAQVCKRIARRIRQLQLHGVTEYRDYLSRHAHEWQILDRLCQVTITRFYRDRMMFAALAGEVLPALAQQALARHEHALQVWSAGCASGEEPYSLALLWRFQLHERFPGLHLHITATDCSSGLLQRASRACYPYACIKNLPLAWREQAFVRDTDEFCLKQEYRHDIDFRQQDLRNEVPAQSFDLVLCRNLAFTYYEDELQRTILQRIRAVLTNGAALVIGIHEALPAGVTGFTSWSDKLRIYRKVDS